MGGGTKIEAPEPVNTGESMRDYLSAIADPDLNRQLYEAEAAYRPQYMQLGLADMESQLFGTGGQGGLMDMLARATEQGGDIQADALSAQREADVADVERLGARATEALRAADPEMQKLLQQQGSIVDQLFGRAQGVTPQQRRLAEQQVRAAGNARGRGYGQGTIAGEILGREEFQQQNRQEYLGAAGQRFGMLGQTAADPFQAILGRPAGALGVGMTQQQFGAQQAGQTMGPQMFDLNTGINLALQQQGNMGNFNAAQAGANATRSAGMMGMVGSIGGAAIGGAMI